VGMSRVTRTSAGVLATLIVAALVLVGCGKSSKSSTSSSGSTKSTNIGFVGALTGDNANLGVNIRDGVKLAIDEANAQPGVKIGLKEFDTAGDPAQASTIKDRFIGDNSVIGLVGPAFSGETKAVLPSLQAAGLPMISSSATNAALPSVVPNETVFHRTIADDALQGSGVASYLAKNVKPKAAAFINDNSEYGKGLADEAQKQAAAQGVKVADTDTVDPKAQDFSAVVNKIKSSGADAVFYGGYYAEAGRLRKQLVDAGVTGTFISGDGSLDPGFIKAAGPQAAENATLTCPCNLALSTSTGALKDFYDRFKSKVGREPGLYSPEAYDAAKILINGIRAGNTTRAKLLDYLNHGVGTYQGVSKTIQFAPNGNLVSREFFVFTVKGGQLASLTQIEVAP
jgi:branched-chain amino acid transport system substrate-binding protein